MAKITYTDKVGVEPKTVRVNQWQDVDANEVKQIVNENDTVNVDSQYPVLFDKIGGRRYGSFSAPMSGTIALTISGAQEGGCAVIVWSGSTTPSFTGGQIETLVGSVDAAGTYSIYMHYIDGRFNINILNGVTPVSPLPIPPTALTAGTTTENSIPLSWTKSATGVMTEYRAYIGGVLQQTFAGDVAAGTLTGLTPNTSYTDITVRAFDGTYESLDSNSIDSATQVGSGSPSATAPTITVTDPVAGGGAWVDVPDEGAGSTSDVDHTQTSTLAGDKAWKDSANGTLSGASSMDNPLTGDFEVRILFSNNTTNTTTGQARQVGFGLDASPLQQWSAMDFIVYRTTGDITQRENNGNTQTTPATICTFGGGDNEYLIIKRVGSTLTAYYEDETGAQTALHTFAATTAADLYFGWVSGTNYTVHGMQYKGTLV